MFYMYCLCCKPPKSNIDRIPAGAATDTREAATAEN